MFITFASLIKSDLDTTPQEVPLKEKKPHFNNKRLLQNLPFKSKKRLSWHPEQYFYENTEVLQKHHNSTKFPWLCVSMMPMCFNVTLHYFGLTQGDSSVIELLPCSLKDLHWWAESYPHRWLLICPYSGRKLISYSPYDYTRISNTSRCPVVYLLFHPSSS